MKPKKTFFKSIKMLNLIPIIVATIAIVLTINTTATSKVDLGAKKPPMTQKYQQNMKHFQFMIADMVEEVVPSVVSIHTKTKVMPADHVSPFEFFFGPGFNPYGNQRNPEKRNLPEKQGLGSGVIISKDGYIVTNNHVVEGANEIKVTLADKQEFNAKVVGRDEKTDIAVIKLEKNISDLPVAFLGDSDILRVGEWVVAIGNPFGLSKTVTTGIVSAKGVHNRGITSYENFIQTDAAINPGNSGGGLFSVNGELIGINTAILSRSGGFQGIGFAVPINMVKRVIDDLINDGKVSRGWLGVGIQELTPEIAKALGLEKSNGRYLGALISEVFENTPAEVAGIKSGDVILKINNKKVNDINDLRHKVANLKPNTKTEFSILRDSKKITLDVIIGSQDKSDELAVTNSKGEKTVLGVVTKSLDMEQRKKLNFKNQGIIVEKVIEDSPAEKARIRSGDIILSANKIPIESNDDLKKILNQSDNAILLLIYRNGHRYYTIVKLD